MATKGPAPRRPSSGSRSSSSRAPAKAGTPATPAKASSSSRSSGPVDEPGELRRSIEGRENEFGGIVFVAVGVLLGLAMYLRLAGPVGRFIDRGFGWLMGLGRFAVPVALLAIGIALIRKGVAESRTRLVIGWTIATAAVLGLLHVAKGPDSIGGDFDAFGDAGGWLGAIVGQPLQALLATAGAVVVLLAVLLGGILVLTGWSLRDLVRRVGSGTRTVVGGGVSAGRKAFGDVTTLSGDRQHGQWDGGSGDTTERIWDTSATETLPAPSLYDVEAEEAAGGKARKKKAAPALPVPIGPAE